jgi:hypothetical protein
MIADSRVRLSEPISGHAMTIIASRLHFILMHDETSLAPRTEPLRYYLVHPYCIGTAKYAINAPVLGSIALPVISPLLFMSFALARKPE